jgi:NitT/TauT family transport system substrate-binding protein
LNRRDCLRWIGPLGLPVGLAACRPESPGAAPLPHGSGEPLQPLRLAIDLWAGYFPALLADELGWLTAAGIELQVSFPADTDAMIADFAAGRYDLIGTSLGDLINITRGHVQAQVLMVCDESAGGDAILLRPGASLQSRKPLLLGTNLGGFGELFVREFLRQRQLQDRAWTWVNVDAADVPRLLASGAIDVGHTWEPYASTAEREGATRLFSSLETPGLIPDVLAATNSTIERRKPLLRSFVQIWLRAVAWWLQQPDRGTALIAQRLRQPVESVSLRGVRLMDAEANARLLSGPQPALRGIVGRYSDHFLSRGSIARPLDPGSLLRSDLLP